MVRSLAPLSLNSKRIQRLRHCPRFFHDKLLGAGSLPPKLLARDVDL